MRSAKLIVLALQVSLAFTVMGAGLHARPKDTAFLLHHRGLLARSILSMNIVMPMLAVWVALVFSLHPAVKVALVALAMSPVPPFLPARMFKTGGELSYIISLLVTASIVALVAIPITLWFLGRRFNVPARLPAGSLATMMLTGILVPVAIGVGLRRFAPSVADRIDKPVAVVAGAVLVAASIPLFIHVWPGIKTLLGNGTLLAMLALTIVALGVGHFLGGPVPEEQSVLALATASRHPAVAITIAHAAAPTQDAVAAAVLLDLLVVALVCSPYASWARHKASLHSRSHAPPPLHEDPRRSAHGHADENAGGRLHVGRRQERRD